MKICSFLPSATEILFSLGVEESICGVTFECDYPREATLKPVVVNSLLGSGLTPEQIDRAVREQAAAGGSLYLVDLAEMEKLQPDLVITQDLCNVCAISAPDIAKVLHGLSSNPRIVSLSPHALGQVLQDIETVGQAVGKLSEAKTLVDLLNRRIDAVKSRTRHARPLRVLCLEWLAPPFQGGHWIPEMVSIAGGEPVLATAGEKSIRLSWQQVLAADPEVLILMPCGFHLHETVAQYHELALPDGWASLSAVKTGSIYAVDGTAYFSRPGPRLVTGLEILQAVLDGQSFDHLPADSVCRLASR